MAEVNTLAELSMVITKASRDKETGTMRLRLVNSDTGADVFGEKMSLELFQDFVERSSSNAPIPEPFREIVEKSEQGWYSGGPPYLSIAHFKSGGGKNVPGEQESLYIDGEMLKSVDILYPTNLGNAVWKSVYNDLDPKKEKSHENPVRVSIGFLDLEHKHEGAGEDGEDVIFTRTSLEDRCELCADGVEEKVYLKGHLVHKAFTRVPANERTLVEVEMTEKSIGTKKEDARSIIGDEADLLDEKSQVAEILVVKAEEDESRDPEPLEVIMENEQEELVEEPVAEVPEEVVEEPQVEEPVVAVAPAPVAEPVKSKIDGAVDTLKSKMDELKAKGIYGEEALKELQPFFNEMGNVVKEEVTPQSPLGDIAGIIRSAIKDIVPTLKQEIVAQLVTELGGLVQAKPADVVVSDRPATRSVLIPRSDVVEMRPEGKKQLTQIEMLARKSTGLIE